MSSPLIVNSGTAIDAGGCEAPTLDTRRSVSIGMNDPTVIRFTKSEEKFMGKKPKPQTGFSKNEIGEAIKEGGPLPSSISPIPSPS